MFRKPAMTAPLRDNDIRIGGRIYEVTVKERGKLWRGSQPPLNSKLVKQCTFLAEVFADSTGKLFWRVNCKN